MANDHCVLSRLRVHGPSAVTEGDPTSVVLERFAIANIKLVVTFAHPRMALGGRDP